MTKTFPKYATHELVSCFNCGGDLGGEWWFTTKNAPGNGRFCQGCEKCRMQTFYDIEPYACELCGQRIDDGKPCGCGART